ncbi:hypothetical protein EDD16DRAFT_19647 [Pisolithus croceorrhizus]|nr:hypothetical protein EDD16DRAFT_19647 [Pisolithus croceorrhizus]KAI6159527.1 hypothetical protein EDD17DRAFT_1611009 [Pisolithus thermaeus]
MNPDESDMPPPQPPTDVSQVDSSSAGGETTLGGLPQSSSSRTWTPVPNLDAQSRANLRQASVALDAAYERITQLRVSINRLLYRVPPESTPQSPHLRGSEAGIGPDHSAIMLSSGELTEDLNLRAERLRTLIPPSARLRLEDFERTRMTRREPFQWERFLHGERPRYLRNDIPSSQTTTVSPLRSRSPPMPDLMVPGTRTSTQPRAYMRHEPFGSDLDDASTTIGRRVAIRVAAGSLEDPHGTSLEQRLQAQTVQIAHELQNMTDRLIARRTGQSAGATSVYGSAPHGTSHAASSARFPNETTPPRRSTEDASSWTPFSRIGGIDASAPPDSSSSSTGLLLPSSSATDVLNPVRTASGVPDVPVALPVFLDLGNPAEVRDRLRDLLSRERHDRLTHPAGEVFRRGNHNASTGQSERTSPPQQQPGQTRRRRGWAHLDADGDEVMSDDDEPHTRRPRVHLSHYSTGEQLAVQLGWRSSPGSEDASEASDATRAESHGDDSPYSDACRPYPLPTTIEEMIVYPKAYQKRARRDIPISRNKCLYGR